jgi:multidrug efflux system membrane fusion protein
MVSKAIIFRESFMHSSIRPAVAALSVLLIAACARNEAATVNAPPAPQVSVAEVVTRPIAEFDQFSGRIAAVERVEIKPRVTGYIAAVNFTEGREVKKGEVLFTIDARPYQAELKRSQADLARARAALALATSEQERANKLYAVHVISRDDFENRNSNRDQAVAAEQVADAALDAAQLNLTFTRVQAPISGQVGRAQITAGNSVTADQTVLTTLVSIDPVYVEFDSDEQVYQKYSARGAEGIPLWVGLASEPEYPHVGKLVFLDNQLDAATGTIRARGRLDNHDHAFTPGMFARVRLSGGASHEAMLIKDSAVGTDQSTKYVYVVAASGQVEYRMVKLGPVVDGLRVVREGLKTGESIVVSGLQRVRPGATVSPQRVAMEEAAPTAGMLARN